MPGRGLLRPARPATAMRVALLVLVAAAQRVGAQCTLPAPDANTAYVQPAGGAPDCTEASVIADGESCVVQCIAGFSQGAAGTYLLSCGAGDLGQLGQGGLVDVPAPGAVAGTLTLTLTLNLTLALTRTLT